MEDTEHSFISCFHQFISYLSAIYQLFLQVFNLLGFLKICSHILQSLAGTSLLWEQHSSQPVHAVSCLPPSSRRTAWSRPCACSPGSGSHSGTSIQHHRTCGQGHITSSFHPEHFQGSRHNLTLLFVIRSGYTFEGHGFLAAGVLVWEHNTPQDVAGQHRNDMGHGRGWCSYTCAETPCTLFVSIEPSRDVDTITSYN